MLFQVYPLFDITPIKGYGSWLWDEAGNRYLDFYGGHAVISIGHSHPHYVQMIQEQVARLGFYSNSVNNPLQESLGARLPTESGYPDYALFMVSSGAEAIENALKLASFATNKKRIVALEGAFHGRTAGAVAITDNPKIMAPVNSHEHVEMIPREDLEALEKALKKGDVAGVIAESVQGVGGIHVTSPAWWEGARQLCDQYGAKLIADEVQAGFGRTGKFFGHQHSWVRPDIITMAKGMGNGFPVGGLLIHPDIKPWSGMLGTTFGGNHLACAAVLAVLDVLKTENLIEKAATLGKVLIENLRKLPQIAEVRGLGLMIGMDLDQPAAALRKRLLLEDHIFTGSAKTPETLRLLPPLTIQQDEIQLFLDAMKNEQ